MSQPLKVVEGGTIPFKRHSTGTCMERVREKGPNTDKWNKLS